MLLFTIFKSILTIVFLFLGLLHFYWLFGGKWAFNAVVPTTTNTDKIFKPPLLATIVVGLTLLFFAFFFWFRIEGPLSYPDFINNYLGWAIAAIFFLRAVGDFNYLGLFKRIKNTDFAKMDTHVYVPLCLMIAVMIAVTEVLIGF